MPSPASGFQTHESPRSPKLVAAHTRDRSSDQEDRQRSVLRSPRLVHQTSEHGGYTVAQYGDAARSPPPPVHQHHQQSTTITTHRYFGDDDARGARPGDSTVDSGLGSYNATSPRPHRYFEAAEPSTTHDQHEWRKSTSPPPLPKSPPPADEPSSAQFEMTRSAEVRLYKDSEGNLRPATIKTQDLTTYGGEVGTGGKIQEQGYDYRVTSDSTAPHLRRLAEQQISPAPLGDIPPRNDYEEPPIDELNRSRELHGVPIENAILQRPAYEEQQK